MNATATSGAILPASTPVESRKRGGGPVGLTREKVREIFMSLESTNVCGRRIGISSAMVSMIRNRKMHAKHTQDLVRPAPSTNAEE